MRETGLDAARASLEARPHPADMPAMASVADRAIPCGHGELSLRIYSPSTDETLPGIVYRVWSERYARRLWGTGSTCR
jgi:acetyl esterase